MRTRLILKPGQPGTKKLTEKYGDSLLCIRFKYDEASRQRLKTVELIVEKTKRTPLQHRYVSDTIVPVRIEVSDLQARSQAKAAGGRWDRRTLMHNRVITICSMLTYVIGWSQRNRGGFILGLDDQGLPYYPMSSGNNDGYILALGLMSFLFTVLYVLGSFLLKRTPVRLQVVYFLNLLFLAVCIFLIQMDSSIIDSAMYGDIVPVFGLVSAFYPALILTLKKITNRSTRQAG